MSEPSHVPDWQTATIAELCAPLSAKVRPRSLPWTAGNVSSQNPVSENRAAGGILARVRKRAKAKK